MKYFFCLLPSGFWILDSGFCLPPGPRLENPVVWEFNPSWPRIVKRIRRQEQAEDMNVECIDYRELPGQNPLLPEYLYHYENVEALYHHPVHLDLDSLKQRADSVLSDLPSFPRDQLVELMRTFNQEVGASEEVFRNLDKLKSSHALAVVTGQQPGLFGGPAFTVYKALTAIRLAQILNEEGYCAVPVFWLASEDSNFREVHSTSFFDDAGELFSVSYPDVENDSARMVGTVSLHSVEQCLDHLQAHGPKGEFNTELLAMLRETYHPAKSFREALGSWLSRLFEPYGLVLFDALLSPYKRDLKSLFTVAIKKRREILQALEARAQVLRERGFDPQVQVGGSESLIFWTEGERRYKLEYGGGEGYGKKTNLSMKVSEERFIQDLDKHIENLVPNVLLRPILQDHLFPTVAYVGGPSEVAYFAQISAISPFWNQEMAIFPRVGITVVDRKAQRLLRKYGVRVSDVLQLTPEEISHKVLKGSDSAKILDKLECIQGDMKAELKSLQSEMRKVDPTVAEMLGGTEKKILYQMEKVQNRFVANHRTHREHFGQHLDYLYSRIYPNGKLQERVTSFNQFLSEEGPDFVHRLMDAINPFCPSHHVIYL